MPGDRDARVEDPTHLLFDEHDQVDRGEHRRAVAHAHPRGRIIALVGFVLVAAIGVAAFVFVRHSLAVPDYSGTGTTPVTVAIPAGDSASDIGGILVDAGVVKSARAFTDAANGNSASANIQPGLYTLRAHMSGKSALALILDPASRDPASDVVVTEGATVIDVAARVAKTLRVSVQSVRAVMGKPSTLGLPSTYGVGTASPSSVEGFLFPATYTIDPGSSVTDVLNQMISKFVEQDRSTGFAAAATGLRLSPYQELTVASIAQAEARFAEDMPKVARVILNRIAARQPLQIDATSGYAAKLAGLDPSKVVYATINSPYNTYTHTGLPPTPISNPGIEAMNAAAAPAAGNWLYYVNSDAAGHLFFTNDQAAFTAAAAKCKANNWGCG